MAEKFTATHEWSKKFIIIKILSNLFSGTILLIALLPVFKLVLRMLGITEGSNYQFAILVLIIFSATLYSLFHYLFINKLYDIISTSMYMKKNLDTSVSFSDAKYLTRLFEPEYVKSGKWITMTQIKQLPADMRRKAIMDTARQIYDNKIDVSKIGQKADEVKIKKP